MAAHGPAGLRADSPSSRALTRTSTRARAGRCRTRRSRRPARCSTPALARGPRAPALRAHARAAGAAARGLRGPARHRAEDVALTTSHERGHGPRARRDGPRPGRRGRHQRPGAPGPARPARRRARPAACTCASCRSPSVADAVGPDDRARRLLARRLGAAARSRRPRSPRSPCPCCSTAPRAPARSRSTWARSAARSTPRPARSGCAAPIGTGMLYVSPALAGAAAADRPRAT